jgi:pentatricopeptide repeat protein
MPSCDVVTWNVMLLGHVKCGQGQKALELSRQMQHQGVWPNCVTFVGVLNACASVTALEECRSVHQQIIASGLESDVFVKSGLVDMYAKCGSIEDAWNVFNKIASLRFGDLECHDIGKCEMWARTECTATISTNATGRFAAKLCYFCGGAECMCQCDCA